MDVAAAFPPVTAVAAVREEVHPARRRQRAAHRDSITRGESRSLQHREESTRLRHCRLVLHICHFGYRIHDDLQHTGLFVEKPLDGEALGAGAAEPGEGKCGAERGHVSQASAPKLGIERPEDREPAIKEH
jgi:hypothetical protein